jgi:hypothetical protein
MTEQDHAWFAPKTYGFGAGLPIAWQGWVVLAALLGLPFGLMFVLLPAHPGYFQGAVIGFTVLMLPLIARKTRGGWRWRNGR